jgi:hypothetical protein
MLREIKKTKKLNTKLIMETYESAKELVETNNARPLNSGYANRGSVRDELRKSWHGVGKMQEAHDLLTFGWTTEHLKTVNRKIRELEKQLVEPRKKPMIKTDVVGFAPIVANAMLGLPKSMVSMTFVPKKSKIVHVLLDSTVSAGEDQDSIIGWGAKVMAELQNLERQGFRVRVENMYDFATDSKNDDPEYAMILRFLVKHEGQPFDIKRFMFPIAHPAMFRAIGFDWEERVPEGIHRSGKGRPMYSWNNELYKQDLLETIIGNKQMIYVNYRSDLKQVFKNVK